jgi:hypothetical protein
VDPDRGRENRLPLIGALPCLPETSTRSGKTILKKLQPDAVTSAGQTYPQWHGMDEYSPQATIKVEEEIRVCLVYLIRRARNVSKYDSHITQEKG